MKRLLILVAVLAGLALPSTAGAAAPCRNRVFNDWYKDGRIASSYPVGCYRDALKHIPADAKIYSSLSTDIRSAMLASIRRQHGKVVPKQVGHGFKPVRAAVKGANEVVSLGRPLGNVPHDPSPGGSVADTASGAPLPILVLGGLALALAGAGGIGAGVRYTRRRRN
jgi:hypothetical protein